MLQNQLNQSGRRIPRTPGPDGPLGSGNAHREALTLQPNTGDIMDEVR